MPLSQTNTERKLAILRKRWVEEPHNRSMIELQAKVLKMGIGRETDYGGDDEFEAVVRNEIVS